MQHRVGVTCVLRLPLISMGDLPPRQTTYNFEIARELNSARLARFFEHAAHATPTCRALGRSEQPAREAVGMEHVGLGLWYLFARLTAAAAVGIAWPMALCAWQPDECLRGLHVSQANDTLRLAIGGLVQLL